MACKMSSSEHNIKRNKSLCSARSTYGSATSAAFTTGNYQELTLPYIPLGLIAHSDSLISFEMAPIYCLESEEPAWQQKD